MGYPQPDPDKYVLGDQEFWRLNTKIISDGDMYQSPQGSGGFAIGPDSDIAKVNIAYFDDQVQGQMNQVAISPQRPYAGTMFARNKSTYEPSKRPGRFLIWPAERFNNEYTPVGLDENALPRVDVNSPVLDVVQYFSPIDLNAGRNDKEYHAQTIPWGVPDNTVNNWIWLIPFYGRRYASITVANRDVVGNPVGSFVVKFAGLTYRIAQGDTDQQAAIVTPLTALDQALAPGAEATVEIKAGVHGMFDYLQLTTAGDTSPAIDYCTIRIRVSDTEV